MGRTGQWVQGGVTHDGLDELCDARVQVPLLEEEAQERVRLREVGSDAVLGVACRVAKDLGEFEEQR